MVLAGLICSISLGYTQEAKKQYSYEELEQCKKDVYTELHRTGLVTPNVCVNFKSYPNFDVKMHNGQYQAGKSEKEFEKQDKRAVNKL